LQAKRKKRKREVHAKAQRDKVNSGRASQQKHNSSTTALVYNKKRIVIF